MTRIAVVAKRIFTACDYKLMATLQHWAGRRHEHKGTRRVFGKHWRKGTTCRLAFATPDGLHPVLRADMLTRPHVRVHGTASPYDGDLRYWTQKRRDRSLATGRMATLLERQRGVCLSCGWLFPDRDTIKVDHMIPASRQERIIWPI
jgi:RNA-directed DNA polymerase